MGREGDVDVQLYLIRDAFKRGMRSYNIDPRQQIAPWLVQGLRMLERDEQPTSEKVEAAMTMGGTDHPDPTLRSMGK
jgi:hypothetical protein